MEVTTKKISARLPADLLNEMDLIASLEHMDRTELMKQAIKDFLKKLARDAAFKEKVVDLYLQRKLSFDKLELILSKEDATAIKASKELMEQGERLAKKLA